MRKKQVANRAIEIVLGSSSGNMEDVITRAMFDINEEWAVNNLKLDNHSDYVDRCVYSHGDRNEIIKQLTNYEMDYRELFKQAYGSCKYVVFDPVHEPKRLGENESERLYRYMEKGGKLIAYDFYKEEVISTVGISDMEKGSSLLREQYPFVFQKLLEEDYSYDFVSIWWQMVVKGEVYL